MINQVIKPGPAIVAGLLLALTAATPALAKDYVSQSTATDVIELYTSEGCSSCPPADRWLSTFKNKPTLFRDVIPMAFHVDTVLHHDFVVLNHQQQTVAANPSQWNLTMPAVPQSGQTKSALVVWLSEPNTQRTIQATGGYL
ncbi:DUF1223 domain-containing protein [Leucothrix pacifica]|uniref:DUF1223 domain-containing protein n=1 Tax=Leucothrix pacifica TaxID=1247513 RepID=A0A317CJI4_9GAMM|nr:DUF1223 domain-containing protein [Leucothrix pacifica]PWQ96490.1 hypothetical protein DKW60_13110 [Leucothrix pacifica]